MTTVRMFIPVLILVASVSISQAASPSLEGKWVSDCYVQTGQHFRDTINITGHNVDGLVQSFSDDKCTALSFAAEAKETYQEGADSMYVKGAKEIDATLSSLSLVYFKASVVAALNKAKFCGDSDWKVAEFKDVTGKKCSGMDMPKQGDRSYDLVQVAEKTLQMGKRTKQYDGTAPEKRPRELDAKKYTRQ